MPHPTFEQWIDWVFSGPEPDFFQLWDNDLDRPATWHLDHATTLFRTPAFLLGSFSTGELRERLWRLPISWGLRDLIWTQEIQWERRQACLQAMYFLYSDLFTKDPLDDTCFMWWDMFREFGTDPDPRVPPEQVKVLARILAIPNTDCQLAALHGLGHNRDDAKVEVLQEYLYREDLKPEHREYAVAALEGRVL